MAEPISATARKRVASRNAILDATGQLIAEHGVDGFTITQIAKRAQINRALVYHYFKNRENLTAHAITHIVSRYELFPMGGASLEAVERSVRLQIEHPELARFFVQMLLNGRPLPRGREYMLRAVAAFEEMKRTRAPQSSFDPTFAVIIVVLAELAWAFAREEIARLLEITVGEADTRFIGQLKQAVELQLQPLIRED